MTGPNTSTDRRVTGFTLVELLIVVMLIAILSVIALPQFHSDRTRAVASTIKASVTQVSMVIEYQKQKGDGKTYPSVLNPEWFVSQMLPNHPDQMAGVPLVETVALRNVTHPRSKLVEPGCPGAYWYNPTEGVFRARVKTEPSPEETLALYNEVNQCSLASLGDVVEADGGAAPGGAPGR